MPCRTLMVYLGLGCANAELLGVAGELAERFQAGVIGVAARQPAHVGAGDGFLFWEPPTQGREALRGELEEAEAEFRNALHNRVGTLEWRSALMCASICEYLVREMRSADLLVIDIGADVFTSGQAMDALDFVRVVGRPVIVVPTLAGKADVVRRQDGLTDTKVDLQPQEKALRSLSDARQMSGGRSLTRADG